MPNERLLQELVDDLRRDGMLVVGTGVSIQASDHHPSASWKGLIEDGIGYCDVPPDRARLLRETANDPELMLGAAEQVASMLRKQGRFRKWLQESVGKIPIRKHEILDAIHALERPIATTNYDDLLTRGRPARAVPWTRVAPALEILRGDRPDVLHLHGAYDEEDSVVFDVRSYERVLANAGAQAIQETLATRNTLLFLGCGTAGLADPNIGALLQWVAETFPDTRYHHYCLCPSFQVAEMKKLHPHLICIDYDDYDALVPLLHKLAGMMHHDTPVPADPAPKRASLPMYEYCFGRDAEVKKVVDALLDNDPRPLPVLGGPGMGKTTIVLKALHQPAVKERFGARRWFVRCEGVRTRAALAAAIAQAMELDVTTKHEAAVLDALDVTSSPAALVLDNFETPWDADRTAVEELLARLSAIPTLIFIATIRGQNRPAGVPWRPLVKSGPLPREEARQAFLAHAGQDQFASDPHLEALLDLVEGVPIAIHTLGKYAEAQPSLKVVLDDWNARNRGGATDLNKIEVSFDLSFDRLRAEGRAVLSVLATLPDGAAMGDFDAIFPASRAGIAEVRQRALVVDQGERMRMLAPIREYVARKYPPAAADREAAVHHYLDLAISEAKKIGTDGGAEAIARLTPEVANIEAALARSAVNDWSPKIAATATEWADFARATGLASVAAMQAVVQGARAHATPADLAICLRALGDVLGQPRIEQARAATTEALQLDEQAGNEVGVADSLYSLGIYDINASKMDRASEAIDRALAIYTARQHTRGRANAIRGKGHIALELDHANEAAQHFRDAIPLYQTERDLLGEGSCLKGLADAALALEDREGAARHYSQALALFQRGGSMRGEAHCIKGLASLLLHDGQREKSREEYEKAMRLYRRIGDVRGIANSLRGVGDCAAEAGDAAEAGKQFREALALFHQIEDHYSAGYTYKRLAALAPDEQTRDELLALALEAWKKIKREDLAEPPPSS